MGLVPTRHRYGRVFIGGVQGVHGKDGREGHAFNDLLKAVQTQNAAEENEDDKMQIVGDGGKLWVKWCFPWQCKPRPCSRDAGLNYVRWRATHLILLTIRRPYV